MPKFVPQKTVLLVCSGGGSASTMLCQFLSHFHTVNCPTDGDSLKHLPLPPVSLNPKFKIIFLLRDPLPLLESIFRREYQHLQSCKLSRCMVGVATVPKRMTLEEYATHGQDLFRFQDQFESYYGAANPYPTLFMKYERLWDNLHVLQKFAGLSDAALLKFPSIRIPSGSQNSLKGYARAKLAKTYQLYTDRLAALPDVFVHQPARGFFIGKVVSSKSFRWAVVNAVRSKWTNRRREVYGGWCKS